MNLETKKIAKIIVKGLKKLEHKGELIRMGKLVGKAIVDLRIERRLTLQQLNRRATI